MLDQVFRRATVRARIRGNPIGQVLERYVAHLLARSHAASPLHQYVFAAEHFGRWLGRRRIDRGSVDRFLARHLPRCQCGKPAVCNIACVRAALNRLLEMLGREQTTPLGSGAARRVLRQYEAHLGSVRGLSAATIAYRVRYARCLLRHFRVRRVRQLLTWTPSPIARYVAAVGGRCKPSSGQVLASSIRSFLRFLRQEDLIRLDLAAAVPSFANWRLASLPAAVGCDQLEKLVAAADASTAAGKRDRAALLCMTELGLRAADVANLRVDAADVKAKVLRLHRPKGRESIELPMTRRLAAAIDIYLCRGRPRGGSVFLFVTHRAPLGRGLTAIGIRDIVIRRAGDAGLAKQVRGSHVLRHSVATALINGGASIKEIADLLGHKSIDTTRIYTKVDLQSLARVALPWPTARGGEVLP